MKGIKKRSELRVLNAHVEKVRGAFPLPRTNDVNYIIESVKAITCGAGSLMGIDQVSRRRHLLERRFSDSTLHDVLNERESRVLLKQAYAAIAQDIPSALVTSLHNQRVPNITVASYDGSMFLKHFVVYSARSGFLPGEGSLAAFTDFQVMRNKGEELPGFDRIMDRELPKLAQWPLPVIATMDGKFFTYERLNRMKGAGVDWMVRVRKDDARNLELIETARAMFDGQSGYVQEAVHRESFIDVWGDEVTVTRTLLTHEKLRTNGAQYPVIVAHLARRKTERSVIHRPAEDFERESESWVITSALYLDAQDLYHVKKRHWEIETLFRTLKRKLWSRNAHCKDPEKLAVLLMMILIAFILLQLVRLTLAQQAPTRTMCRETTYQHAFALFREFLRTMVAEVTDVPEMN